MAYQARVAINLKLTIEFFVKDLARTISSVKASLLTGKSLPISYETNFYSVKLARIIFIFGFKDSSILPMINSTNSFSNVAILCTRITEGSFNPHFSQSSIKTSLAE